MTDVIYWIWLSIVCGNNYRISEKLLESFGCNAKRIYDATDDELSDIFGRKTPKFNHDLDEAQSIYDYCKKNKIGLLYPGHEYYPKRLFRIDSRPLLLYYMGMLPDIDSRLCIATVGTRRMTEYGKRLAYSISYDLAKAGAVVVSGMALGVDGMCHRAAIDAKGSTLAILGCGIDVVYPKEHEQLMNELIRYGTVMTEYKPGSRPEAQNFPLRNRIISGLSEGTVVIEASYKSGALITARHALHQGRNIYATPGNIGELNSEGTNRLLKSGAKIVTTAQDIIEDYATLYRSTLHVERLANISAEDRLKLAAAMDEPVPSKPIHSTDYDRTYPRPPKMPPKDSVRGADIDMRPETFTTSKTQKNVASKDSQQGCADTESENNGFSCTADIVSDIINKEDTGDDQKKNPPKTVIADSVKDPQDRPQKPLNEKEKLLLSLIPEGKTVRIDSLFGHGLTTSEILQAVTMLEIKQMIVTGAGNSIRRR